MHKRVEIITIPSPALGLHEQSRHFTSVGTHEKYAKKKRMGGALEVLGLLLCPAIYTTARMAFAPFPYIR